MNQLVAQPRTVQPSTAFGGTSGFQNSELYSGFFIIEVLAMKLRLRFSLGGIAPSQAEATKAWNQIKNRRNMMIPSERMSIENIYFGATEQLINQHKMEALRGLPKKMSAEELGGGSTGYVLHKPIAALLKECREDEAAGLIFM